MTLDWKFLSVCNLGLNFKNVACHGTQSLYWFHKKTSDNKTPKTHISLNHSWEYA